MNRLLHHDRMIVWNTIRATFSEWRDKAIAVLIVVVAIAAIRVWFTDLPSTVASWTALSAGTLIGISAGRFVATRLAFHAFDGLLAADALNPKLRRDYLVASHAVGLALLAAVALIARPLLLVIVIPAYIVGVLVAALMNGIGMSTRIAGTTRPTWTFRAWSHRPIAGSAAAAILLLSLVPTRTLGMSATFVIVSIETVLLTLMLTRVDDTIVRFMTITGHGSRSTIVYHAKAAASFFAVAAPSCWMIFGPFVAGIVAAMCAAMLLLLTLRVLAYRLHTKRSADLLVSILAGLLMLVAYSIPVALPVIALAILLQLHRQGLAKTWLLA